jgi:hypothetical protein
MHREDTSNVINDKHLIGRLWLSFVLSFLFLGLLCSFISEKININFDCDFLDCNTLKNLCVDIEIAFIYTEGSEEMYTQFQHTKYLLK